MGKIVITVFGLILLATLWLGISTAYAGDIKTLNGCSYSSMYHIALITTILRHEGYKIPTNFTCNTEMTQMATGEKDMTMIDGMFYVPYSLVYLNDKSVEPEITLMHEIGHYNYYLKLGEAKFNKIGSEPIDEKLKPIIKKTIGSYATTDKGEFVAEVFAYKHFNVPMPKAMLDYYVKCGGI